MNEAGQTKLYTEADLKAARREAWEEAWLACYPLLLAVERFVDNGGDAWGNLDDPLEQVQGVSNPYTEPSSPVVEPPMFAGTQAALDSLTIRAGGSGVE